jgi:cytochrome P450
MTVASDETAPRAIRGPKRMGMLDVIRFLRDPRGVAQRLAREWGDPFLVPDPKQPTLMTGNPEAIRTVFTADPDVFAIPLRDQLAPFLGDTSLILTSGARHKQDRKLLAPSFHGARMRAYGKTIVESALTAASKWTPGKPFKMLEATQAITLEVILRAVFGVEAGPRKEPFREAVVQLMAAMSSPLLTMFEFTRRSFGGLGPWARFQRARARFDALVAQEIADRRAHGVAGREDILSLMMEARYDDGSAMSDLELRDQLHLLLFAGHDTTSTALAWAFYWLERQPEERERVLAEIAALGPDPEPDALAGLPYLDAVCQESLRIHPVVMNVGRLLAKPLDVMGCEVPAGTTILMSTLILHDREELYPEPRRFRPQRFLERKFSPHELIPFGGGPRRCIGAALAMYEMKVVLGTLLPRYRVRLVKDVEVKSVISGLTMEPKGGIPMVLEGPR